MLDLYSLTYEDLTQWLTLREFSATHAARIWKCLYHNLACSVGELCQLSVATEQLPASLLQTLQAECFLAPVAVAKQADSTDGLTRKYLLELSDHRQIETVLMRYPYRATGCVSSQVGCAMGCIFCATGQMGFSRQLSAGEIVAQVVHLERQLLAGAVPVADNLPVVDTRRPDSPKRAATRLRNLVLMGMGEPLHNYDAVLRAVDILRHPSGLGLGGKRITLSTVGVVPGILRLADEGRTVSLAVSLHATTQAGREALIPVAKAWPLEELLAACRYYTTKLQRKIFFEWTLIAGENDSPETAAALGQLLQGIPAQVNLIPLNPTEGYAGGPTAIPQAKAFQAILAEYGLPSTLRQRRGIDIAAGCGQLATA